MKQTFRLSQIATTKNRPGLIPVSPATIWRWVRENKFPQPFKLADRVTVWDAEQVNDWLVKKAGGR